MNNDDISLRHHFEILEHMVETLRETTNDVPRERFERFPYETVDEMVAIARSHNLDDLVPLIERIKVDPATAVPALIDFMTVVLIEAAEIVNRVENDNS